MRFARRLSLVGCLVALSQLPLLAQQPQPAPTHRSTIVGVAIDSIHGGALSDATILLNGTTLSTITDTDGKFRFDSVAPGSYRIAMFHPLLDTLHVAVGTSPLRMGADSVRQVILATPSPRTIIDRACPAARRRLGPAAIMGRIEDPDTHAPMSGVRVSVAWQDLSVSRVTGVRRTSVLREATTDSDGAYIVCGIAAGMRGTIQADRAKTATAEVPVALGDARLAFQSLALSPLAITDSQPAIGRAVLTGRVVDQSGSFVADAHVTVQGARAQGTTTATGEFRMTDLPSGTRAVLVRRIGYAPAEVAVTLGAAAPVSVTVHIEKSGTTLSAVNVLGAYEAALMQNGFTDRKRMGMGRYMTAEQIASRQLRVLSDLFRTLPGFKVTAGLAGNKIESTRSGCITYWVDGVQQREGRTGDVDTWVRPDQIMALETYSAAEAPQQFTMAGAADCSVVVIWSNRTIR